MKISTILILAQFFIAMNCSAQDATKTDCSILKDVKLKYLDFDDTTAYLVIKLNKHIEYHNNKKYYIKSDIAWVNDCEYNMAMTEITIPNFPYGPGDVMNVKINKIEGDIIYYTSTVKRSSWEGRFRIIKD